MFLTENPCRVRSVASVCLCLWVFVNGNVLRCRCGCIPSGSWDARAPGGRITIVLGLVSNADASEWLFSFEQHSNLPVNRLHRCPCFGTVGGVREQCWALRAQLKCLVCQFFAPIHPVFQWVWQSRLTWILRTVDLVLALVMFTWHGKPPSPRMRWLVLGGFYKEDTKAPSWLGTCRDSGAWIK